MKAMKWTVSVFALLAVTAGCSGPVKSRVVDNYMDARPSTVFILPVSGEVDAAAKELIRSIAAEKLKSLNYAVVKSQDADDAYVKMGSKNFSEMSPDKIAALANADSVLSIRVGEWKERVFTPYASLKLVFEFTLHGAKGSQALWRAGYSASESDYGLDKTVLQYGVIKAYEPAIERIMSSVFLTLPAAPAPVAAVAAVAEKAGEKSFFEWLK